MGLRSHLPQLHAVEHIVLHTINLTVPTLVKVTVEPIAKGVIFGIEISVEVIHYLALAFYIVQQVFITYRPSVQSLMGRQFAERGGGVGDNRIDGANLVYGIELVLVINGSLIGPVNIGDKGRIWLLEMEVFGVHAVGAINGGCPTYA